MELGGGKEGRRMIWWQRDREVGWRGGGIETAASAGIFMLFAYLCGCQEGGERMRGVPECEV